MIYKKRPRAIKSLNLLARAPCSASSRHHVLKSITIEHLCSLALVTIHFIISTFTLRTSGTSGTSGTSFTSFTPYHHLNIHTQNIRNIRYIRYIVDIIHISSHTEHQVHQVHRSHHCVKTYCRAPLKEPI